MGYGISAEPIWGADPDRGEKLARHKQGVLKVLANCALLTEGYDDPNIGCILMARPTQSEPLYCQIVGRGTRLPEGVDNLLYARQQGVRLSKEDCIVIDLVDNSSKHSLMTLPSLFGLHREMDLMGQTLSSVADQLERRQGKSPYVHFTSVRDTDKLEAYAEQVNLFRFRGRPNVIQIGDYKWFRSGKDYVLFLEDNENVVVINRSKAWHVVGAVRSVSIREVFCDLETAIKTATLNVYQCGGRALGSSWGYQPPTNMQLSALRRYNIPVPAEANRKWCHDRITEELTKAHQRHYS
jgi:hypothetical protein